MNSIVRVSCDRPAGLDISSKQIQAPQNLRLTGGCQTWLAVDAGPEGILGPEEPVRLQGQLRVKLPLSLGEYLVMGRGEESEGGRKKDRNLAGCFEALVGAIFKQFGYGEASRFVIKSLDVKDYDLLKRP